MSKSKGWRSGESTRLPPMWPGFESWRRRHMWVKFVVGPFPYSERFFSGYSGFPLFLKTNTFKFQFDRERTDTFQRVLMNSLVLCGKNYNLFKRWTGERKPQETGPREWVSNLAYAS